jgi:HEAT repeat protein
MRSIPVFLVAGLLALALAGSPARAENPGWAEIQKSFQSDFKPKEKSLDERKKAIGALAKSEDGRAVKELLDALKKQDKHAKKMREEWAAEDAAWTEKTERLEKGVEERRKRAAERGEDSINVNQEEADWLGANNKEGKMMAEKARIEKLYKSVLGEEDLGAFMLRKVAQVINSVTGAEQDSAVGLFATEAQKADGERRMDFLKALGYVKGDRVTDLLEKMSKDTDSDTVQTALESIGRQNSERGITILSARLEDPRWQVRASAITGLTFYKDCRVVDALIAGAKREDGVLQRNYFVALSRIVQENVPGTVEAWDSWWAANREDMVEKWRQIATGEPVIEDPPDVPVDTNLGSTSFYGITTNSKHIIFVVDISGSMGEQGGKNDQGKMRIDVAREELKKAVNSLTATDEDDRGAATFNIVVFATYVEVYKTGKMIAATKKAKDDAMKWIDEKIQPTTATNIFDAVEQAFNVISASSDKKNLAKGADTMFLMSDGGPNRGRFVDPELILRAVKEMNATRKITIHTIGVGQGHNAPFMQTLAAQNGGQYISR